jgi:hypothetical protein
MIVDADHPSLALWHGAALDEYAHTGLTWGAARVTQGQYGVWCAGALDPNTTPEQLRIIRQSSMSGDWRPVHGLPGPQLIATLLVNRPGFPVAREGIAAATARALVHYGVDGELLRLARVNVPGDCSTCLGVLDPVDDELLRIGRELLKLARTNELRSTTSSRCSTSTRPRTSSVERAAVRPVQPRCAARALDVAAGHCGARMPRTAGGAV